MATRSRRTWKPDSRGYYSRQLGWERSRTGKLQQHKFLLGTDRKKAEKLERKLCELWETFAASCEEDRPLWPDDLLIIAKRIAKGTPQIPIPRGPSEKQHQYAARIQRMQAKYPVVLFLPEDQHAYEVGQDALVLFESMQQSEATTPQVTAVDVEVVEAIEEAKKRLAEVGIQFSPELAILADACTNDAEPLDGVIRPGDPAATAAREKLAETARHRTPTPSVPVQLPPSRTPTAMFYQAIRAYQKYLEKEYHDPEVDHITPWGKTQVRQLKNLQKHHADRLLTKLNADAVKELVAYWRRRPARAKTKEPMTAKTCSNYCSTLMRFLKWLDQSSQFDWSKPFAFSDIDTRIRTLVSDHAKKSLEQVATFSLEELTLLMRYAQPFERSLILLALNCGFGQAEIASLLVGEVYLFSGHSERHCEILNYKSTDADSFIKRVRRKSGVYGEFILFPMTVAAIQWATARRKPFAGYADKARLVVSKDGTALDKPTKGGNANQLIPNHFSRLIQRIRDDDNEISKLSFGKLRKTASDLIKRFSDGEIAAVFDCHGTPVKTDALSDAYTNRPFGKVFTAIHEVEAFLAPVFAAAGPTPFVPQAQAYTKRSTIDRIAEMHDERYPTGQIAVAVGMSDSAVSRHIQVYSKQKQNDSNEKR